MMSSGKPKRHACSPGSLAATTSRSPSSIWKPAVVATACIPIAPTRTGAENPWCRIFSAFPKFDRWPVSAKAAPSRRRWSLDRRRVSLSPEPTEDTLSQFPFLNRQALYLRPDPTQGYRSSVQAGNGTARPQSNGQDPRQSYCRTGTLAGCGDRRRAARGRAGEFSGTPSQSAAGVRVARRGDGSGACRSRRVHPGATAVGRGLLSQRVFV